MHVKLPVEPVEMRNIIPMLLIPSRAKSSRNGLIADVLLQVGWEEVTEAAMTQSLRSCLAKSQKDTAVVPALATAQDTTRVQRHISLVIERLKKGMTLFGSSNAP